MRLGALLLLLMAVGCEDRFARARRETHAAEAEVDVPVTRARALPEAQPRTRILVRGDRISVDQAGLAGAWPEKQRERLIQELGEDAARRFPLVRPRAATLARFRVAAEARAGFLLPGVSRALEEAARIEKVRAGFAGDEAPFEGHVAIVAARDVPYETLARVLYSAGQAEYGAWELVVREGTHRRFIEVDAPRIPNVDHDLDCAVPEIAIGPAGIQVKAGLNGVAVAREGPPITPRQLEHALSNLGAIEAALGMPAPPPSAEPAAPPPPPPPQPRWLGNVMLGPSRACPSVPGRAGHQDVRALVALLREMATMSPGCRVATVSAAPDVAWADLAAVLEAVVTDGSYPIPQLAISDPTTPSCEGGLRPAEAAVRP